jgi:ligand-binding sensor protein
MARKVPKRDYGQAKSTPARKASNWTPFATSKPAAPAHRAICTNCDGAGTYDAFDRAANTWFRYNCNQC